MYRNNRRHRGIGPEGLGILGFVGMGAFLIAVVGGGVWFVSSTQKEITCTVEDKDRVMNSEGSSEMRIYTEDCGVLKLEDTLFAGVVNSADLYAQIKPGETYDFKVYGIRLPLLSQFETILEVH